MIVNWLFKAFSLDWRPPHIRLYCSQVKLLSDRIYFVREYVKVPLKTQRSSHKCTIYIFHQSISSTKALEALVKWKHPIVFSSTIHLWQHSAIRQDISFVEGSRFMWIGSTLQCIEITLAAFFFWSHLCFLLSKTFRV